MLLQNSIHAYYLSIQNNTSSTRLALLMSFYYLWLKIKKMSPVVTTVPTADGTVTLHVAELNENYHSLHGAMQESMHVFIAAGLHSFKKGEPLRIFEVGFGTGLNCLLTRMLATGAVIYHAIELHPLDDSITEKLNYAQNPSEKNQFDLMHAIAWNEEKEISKDFLLKKINADLLIYNSGEKYDLIYFDAFGPNAQPEMWSKTILDKMYAMLNPGGILVTYCAKGEVKRNLKEAGFQIETLPGPPGKREMTRGRRI
jgi:tRNA U34 5-methylaminomethyl-2-thiouridine-forming methyltransferase MnmC